jgi:hypothetical protein
MLSCDDKCYYIKKELVTCDTIFLKENEVLMSCSIARQNYNNVSVNIFNEASLNYKVYTFTSKYDTVIIQPFYSK